MLNLGLSLLAATARRMRVNSGASRIDCTKEKLDVFAQVSWGATTMGRSWRFEVLCTRAPQSSFGNQNDQAKTSAA